jgi:hypothetical protein
LGAGASKDEGGRHAGGSHANVGFEAIAYHQTVRDGDTEASSDGLGDERRRFASSKLQGGIGAGFDGSDNCGSVGFTTTWDGAIFIGVGGDKFGTSPHGIKGDLELRVGKGAVKRSQHIVDLARHIAQLHAVGLERADQGRLADGIDTGSARLGC